MHMSQVMLTKYADFMTNSILINAWCEQVIAKLHKESVL